MALELPPLSGSLQFDISNWVSSMEKLGSTGARADAAMNSVQQDATASASAINAAAPSVLAVDQSFESARQAMAGASAQLLDVADAASNTSIPLVQLGYAAQDVAGDFQSIPFAATDASEEIEQVGQSANDAGAKMQSAGKGAGNFAGMIGSSMTRASAFAKVMPNIVDEYIVSPWLAAANVVKDGAEAIVDAVKSTGEGFANMELLAERTNVSTEWMSKWSLVAETVGLSSEELATGMYYLQQHVGEIADGSAAKDLVEQFQHIGLSADFLKEHLNDTAAIFDAVREGYAKLPTGDRAEFLRVMGRQAKDMIPLLNMTQEHVEELSKTFAATGATVSNSAGEMGRDWKDNVAVMEDAWTGLERAVGTPFIEHINDDMAKMNDGTHDWAATLGIAHTIAEGIATALEGMLVVLEKIAKYTGLEWLANKIGGSGDVTFGDSMASLGGEQKYNTPTVLASGYSYESAVAAEKAAGGQGPATLPAATPPPPINLNVKVAASQVDSKKVAEAVKKSLDQHNRRSVSRQRASRHGGAMTPIDNSAILDCTYGAAGFRIEKFKHSEKPITRDGYGRVGTQSTIECEGWIDGANFSDYETKLVNCVNTFRLDGQQFQIKGPTGLPIITFLPSASIGGGPFVEFDHSEGPAPLSRKVKVKISAPVNNVQANTPGAAASNNYIARTAVLADGRQVITWSGTIHGVSSGIVFGQFLSAFQNTFQLPNWVVTFESESSTEANQGRTTYKLNAEQMAAPLPAGGGNFAVDGEITQNYEIDEQGRKTFVTGANCTIKGDPTAFHQYLRGRIDQTNYPIFRESFALATTRGLRVTSRFTQLIDAEADGLIEFAQQLAITRDTECWEERTFVGAAPIAVKKPVTLGMMSQRGRAIALGEFMTAPDAVSPWLTRPPEIEYAALNSVEFETTWSYEMFSTDPTTGNDQNTSPYVIERPISPEFE